MLAAGNLLQEGLKVHPHRQSWAEYFAELSDTRVEKVLTALDTAEDRIGVQASLPKQLFNAWTQQDNLGVSRHSFLGTGACLACLYIPRGPTLNEDQIVAAAIRLPDQLMAVRMLLYTNHPVGRDMLLLLAERWGVPVDALLEYEGQSIRVFYQRAICGGALLKLGADLSGEAVPVPMAHQSVLAGVMLAAALVSDVKSTAASDASAATLNLLRPLGPYILQPLLKHPEGRCICQDAFYQNAYGTKYGLDAAEDEEPAKQFS
jgi:hypothetical protein